MKFNFLNQMRLGQKFWLLAVIAATLFAFPFYNSVKASLDSIENVRTEQGGLPSIAAIEQLLQAMQDHRTASSYFVQKNETGAAPRPKAAALVAELLGKLDGFAAPTGDDVLIKRLAEVKRDWTALKADVDAQKIEERAVVGRHSELIQKTLLMIQDWTAYSQIDLDPDAAAYYSFRAALIDLPPLKEAIRALRSPVVDRLAELAKLRAAGAPETALRAAWTPEDRARFLNFILMAEASVKSFGDNMRKAMATSPAIKAETGDQVVQLTLLSDQAMSYARKELLDKEIPTADPVAFGSQISISRAVVIKASEQTLRQLEAALGARDAKVRRELYLELALTAVLLALGLIVAVFTVRNITGAVANLQTSVERVRGGDTVALQGITAKDEMGDLGRTVNTLLEERMAVQNKTELENRTLNESVIGLLQTVFQLGERDLTVRAAVTEDLIGTVASSINQFTDETGRTLGNVQSVAQQVRQTADAVRVQTMLVQDNVLSERDSLARMTTSLGQAVETLDKVAALSTTSNQAAENAARATQQALGAVNGTVAGMDGLRESISEMEKRFKRLGERSQEISTAVGLINTISERTHVLALNASMQAATAGEAGRGFAVVAEEVQRLSDSSRQATGQISQLVSNIQAETNETLFTVNRLISEVVKQSELAQRAGDQMTQTQEITGRLVGLVQQISAFSAQQADLSRALQNNVSELNLGTVKTAEAVSSQAENTSKLVEQAQTLTESVGRFKLVSAE